MVALGIPPIELGEVQEISESETFYSCKSLPDKIFFSRDVTFCEKNVPLYINASCHLFHT